MLVTEALFKSELGGIQSSLAFKTVEPFLKIADRTFKQKIGIELYNTLLVPTEELEELSNIAKGIVSWSGFELAFPHLKMKAGDLGLMKSSPNNTVAITKWEYVDSKEAIVQMIDKLSEDFYELLEELAPQAWKESAAYKKRNRLFINSATTLGQKITLVGRNNRFFDVLTTYIQRAENTYIRPLLTPTVFLQLKEKWQNAAELTSTEEELIELIQWALAYLSIFEAYPYLPMVVDQNGMRETRYKDGTREEEMAGDKPKNAQRQALWNDGQGFLKDIEAYLDTTATATVFSGYYTKNLIINPVEPDDYTDKAHVML